MSLLSEMLADSPRALYKCDESASNQPQDSSGNAMHSTTQTGITWGQTGIPAVGGTSIQWVQASAAGVGVPDNNLLDLGNGPFTLEAWVKRTATQSTAQAIIAKGTGAYYMRLASDNTLNLLREAAADVVHSTTTLTDTTSFHHCVATKSAGAAYHLYIDSVDVTGTPTDSTFIDTATTLNLGISGGGESADLYMAYLAVYPTELSAARVLAHYNAGQGIVAAGTQIIQVRSGLRLA